MGEVVNIGVNQNLVVLTMKLSLQENLTTLPILDVRVDSTNATVVSQTFLQPINSAIQKRVSNAAVSDFVIHIATLNNTKFWSLTESYNLTVVGANTNSGSRVTSDLSFIAMNVNQAIQTGGLELNQVGPGILLSPLQAKSAAYSNLLYYIDGSQTRNAVIPDETTRLFNLLDFSWVPPVSSWSTSQDLLGQSVRWTYDPTSSRYNLTLGVPSPEGPLLQSFVATYSPSFSIAVPANAWVRGNTVYFDAPTPAETAMPILALVSLLALLATFIIDRRLAPKLRVRKKR